MVIPTMTMESITIGTPPLLEMLIIVVIVILDTLMMQPAIFVQLNGTCQGEPSSPILILCSAVVEIMETMRNGLKLQKSSIVVNVGKTAQHTDEASEVFTGHHLRRMLRMYIMLYLNLLDGTIQGIAPIICMPEKRFAVSQIKEKLAIKARKTGRTSLSVF